MIIVGNVSTLDQSAANFRRRALRDAVACIGWIKLSSVICYVILFILTYMNSRTEMGFFIQIMTIVPIVPQVVLAVLLFLGAIEGKVVLLQLSICLSLMIGMYNGMLGVIGFVYFIQTSYYTMHFILAIMFAILAVSIFSVLCHDILIIQTYRNELDSTLDAENETLN